MLKWVWFNIILFSIVEMYFLPNKCIHHHPCQVTLVYRIYVLFTHAFPLCKGQTCQQSGLASTERRQRSVGLPQLSMKFLENLILCHPRACETWAVRRITDNEVLAGSQPHYSKALLTLMQLHWAGYKWRMDGGRMLNQLLGVKLKWAEYVGRKKERGCRDIG